MSRSPTPPGIICVCILAFPLTIFLTLPQGGRAQETAPARPTPVEGIWKGRLEMDLLFSITRDSRGVLSASFHVPQQGAFNIPFSDVRFEDDSLHLGAELSNTSRLSFRGALDRQTGALTGMYSDGSHEYPMTFRSGARLLARMAPRVDSSGRRVESYRYARPATLDDGWETADLSTAGVDTARVGELVRRILREEFRQIHGLVIVKNGRLVLDEYFYGTTPGEIHFIASITKAVTSLLVGVAHARGSIPDLHAPVREFFPEYARILNEEGKRDLTLHHLLSMSAGLEWDEQSYNYLDSRNSSFAMGRSSDGLRYLFERRQVTGPGERFVYNSGLPVALSSVIHKTTGMDIGAFARENLFAPLGIMDYRWEKLADGNFHAGGGLHLRPRDMAKLGVLLMDRGRFGSQQIVPEDWFTNCSRRYFTGSGPEYWNHWSPHIEFLGDTPVEVYSAAGLGGQFIYAVPHLGMIVVFTSDFFGSPGQMARIMRDYLLPVFLQAEGTPPRTNFTSKQMRVVGGYSWTPAWVAEMACVISGAKVLKLDASPSWLYGITGHAFSIAVDSILTPGMRYRANTQMRDGFDPGAGFRMRVVQGTGPAAAAAERQAWRMVRESIDAGFPCYGFHIGGFPEYYLVFGYDSTGYYYRGFDHENGDGPVPVREPGVRSGGRIIMKAMVPVRAMDDRRAMRQALEHAAGIRAADPVEHVPGIVRGPDAYLVWAEALREGRANALGAALHAVAWGECRQMAVEFLKECRDRVPAVDSLLFDNAISCYSRVSDHLDSVSHIYPFFVSAEDRAKNVTDNFRSQAAAGFLLEARKAEIEGTVALREILLRSTLTKD